MHRARQTLGLGALGLLAFGTTRCSSAEELTLTQAAAPPEPPGIFIEGKGAADPAWFAARKLSYVRFETQRFEPENPVNALAHLARKRLDAAGYTPPGKIPADAWDGIFADMDALKDGRDFNGLYVLTVLLGYGDDPMVPPELKRRTEEALARFKYWFTEPTEQGKTDDSYYWSENHQILFHTIEYFMGLRFPDRPLGADRKLGREHEARAKAMILRWLEHRLRFGFAEWHSNVYYQKNVTPLLLLVEHSPDLEIRARASMVLDILFSDFALHTLRDAYGVTHGRSYKKDKMRSTDEDTWGLTKMLFAQSAYEWSSGDPGASVLAATKEYVLPELIRREGADMGPLVDRERMSLPMLEATPMVSDPEAPYGFSYTNPDDLVVWWGMGALTAYPVVPLTIDTFNRYGLWDSEQFEAFRELRSIAPSLGQNLSATSHAMLNFGLMRDVDTYTYRTADVMLSSAIDYRKGTFNQQMHSWQATLDPQAIVFTNHPFRPLATSGDWRDDPENGGYWNGEASAPRSAQIDNVAIHIYAPQYPIANAKPFEYFHYEPYTHAYFPQDYFDEVVQQGNWTFGRFKEGYVALYSHRPATFLVYDGVTQATDGRTKPFDLRADGGADNVWIVEVARERDWGSFAKFIAAISAAKVDVKSRGPGKSTGEKDGFDVSYASPSQGLVTFGWEAPLVASGKEIPLHIDHRLENPYGRVPIDPTEIKLEQGGYAIRLDVKQGRRFVIGPP